MARQPYEKVPDGQRTGAADPQKEAGFFSILAFCWMTDLLKTGAKRPLEESDFLPLQEEDETQRLTEKIQELWSREKKKCAELKKEPRLWKSVLGMVSFRQFGFLMFTGLLDSVCRVSQAIMLGFLISEIVFGRDDERYFLYLCAAAMFLIPVVRSQAVHQFSYRSLLLGMQMRAALKCIVYIKILHLSRQTLRDFTAGQVVDLISNDVQRMEQAPMWFFRLLLSFFDITVSVPFMWYFCGSQSLAGLAFLALLVPFCGLLARIGGKLRKETAEVSDRRVMLMNEVVTAIRAVKTNVWEWVYMENIGEIRREEISVIRQKSAVLSILSGLFFTCNTVAIFVSVTLIVLTGHKLTPVNTFMLVAFMNFLRLTVSYSIAYGLQYVAEATTSLARIQCFLLLPNLPYLNETPYVGDIPPEHRSVSTTHKYTTGPTGGIPKGCLSRVYERAPSSGENDPRRACAMVNVTLHPDDDRNRCILRNITIEASHGSLVVLTGPIGSGKSSLLAAINKEIVVSEGSIFCSGTIAYVSQTPWVFPGTVRENILFGNDYDECRFETVLEVCALKRDLEIFPDGDLSVIGIKGASLSGGQQSRISLARAVYADGDVYLLDDPLGAVDAKVGEHIFEKCICDFLSTKTRLLVTHQINHMKAADQIVLLSNVGEVLTEGSFAELKGRGMLDAILDTRMISMPDQKMRRPIEQGDGDLTLVTTKDAVTTGLEIPDEDRSTGRVSLNLYWKYFRAGKPTVLIVGLFCLFLLAQGILVSVDVWLSHLVNEPMAEQGNRTNMVIYTGLVCGTLFLVLCRSYLFYQASLSSSEQLHDRMVLAILKAPVLFFDTNPVGRILNRFSKDVGSMDEVLPTFFIHSIQLALFSSAAILLPSVLNPWLVLAVVPTIASFIFIVRYYLKSSRELKRLESICRSPIFSHFSETLNGLDTIRSRGRQQDFVQRLYRHQNKHNQAFNLCLASVQWMAVRVDLLSAFFIGAVALSAILVSQDAVQAGLSMVYVIQIIGVAQYAVQQTSDVENQMTSVERVLTYTEIESEPGYDIDTKPPEDWPRDASIAFNNVSLRYYPGGPEVLRDLNINIEGNAKIGVAGRTGAGKSSIIAALLRMPEAKGVITIDGINLASLNLQDSRRCVSILGQKTVLFSGPLRKNLDPLTQHEDSDLWRVLGTVQLKTLVQNLEGHLDYEVSEGGGNFSVGERQLLCLARVLLQQNKVLILDEPTAHVDPATERTIRNTVRDQLKDCTVVTVAHRLNTIRDCDKILVMKDGTAVEFDNYEGLVKKEGGVFAEMAEKQS